MILAVEGFQAVNATRSESLWFWITFNLGIVTLIGAAMMVNSILDQDVKGFFAGLTLFFVAGFLTILAGSPS